MRVAYRDVIAAGRHPVVALFLDLPPDELDVNVHPAKTELRFRDAGAVRSLVISALRRALRGRRRRVACRRRAPRCIRPVPRLASGAATAPRSPLPAACRLAGHGRRRRWPSTPRPAAAHAAGRRAALRPASARRLSRWARRWRRCSTPT